MLVASCRMSCLEDGAIKLQTCINLHVFQKKFLIFSHYNFWYCKRQSCNPNFQAFFSIFAVPLGKSLQPCLRHGFGGRLEYLHVQHFQQEGSELKAGCNSDILSLKIFKQSSTQHAHLLVRFDAPCDATD